MQSSTSVTLITHYMSTFTFWTSRPQNTTSANILNDCWELRDGSQKIADSALYSRGESKVHVDLDPRATAVQCSWSRPGSNWTEQAKKEYYNYSGEMQLSSLAYYLAVHRNQIALHVHVLSWLWAWIWGVGYSTCPLMNNLQGNI